jgi:seryl-tRNA synthetase
MHELRFIREHPDAIRRDLEKRHDKEKLAWLDDILKSDEEWRKVKPELDLLRNRRNVLSEEINKAKKEGKDISGLIKEVKELPDRIRDMETKEKGLLEKINYIQMRLPNTLHDSVPFGKTEEDNKVVRKFGAKKPLEPWMKAHGELAQELGVANFDKAAEISGNGFYYLMGDLALMEQALIRFALDTLTAKGYKFIEVPFMMRRKPYEGVTDLADFETMMYKIEGEDLYLIATSEHPIAALMQNTAVAENELPKKFVGYSTCFRKEIGSSGVDTKGTFRVHQFNKVEQFIFCRPEDSWKLHEELLKNTEEIFKKLKIPFRVVNICTGDIGTVAAKKYDIEAWVPREQKYREVASLSNCTAYQATRLNIKFIDKEGNRQYVHTLNATAMATSRAMKAIIENYQNADGTITIPKVLQKYMGKKALITKQ